MLEQPTLEENRAAVAVAIRAWETVLFWAEIGGAESRRAGPCHGRPRHAAPTRPACYARDPASRRRPASRHRLAAPRPSPPSSPAATARAPPPHGLPPAHHPALHRSAPEHQISHILTSNNFELYRERNHSSDLTSS